MEKDFTVVKEKLFNGELKEMELERVQYVKKFWSSFFLVLTITAALVGAGLFFDNSAVVFYFSAFAVLLIGFAFMTVKYNQFHKKMYAYFKQTIVPNIAKQLMNASTISLRKDC